MTEYIQETFVSPILVWMITGCLAFISGWMIQKRKKDSEEDVNIKSGVIALLRLEIIKEHREHTQQGYCTVADKETIQQVYDSYHKLGGNGMATELLEEIWELPAAEPKQ